MPNDLSHRTNRKLSPGSHYPLGATLGPGGVNFSLYSANAEEVRLLLFDRPDGEPTDVIRVENRDRFAWHVFVHGAGAGQFYGYKVRGPFDPARGLRFNDRKLLIDPYAKALTGKIVNEDNLLLAYDPATRRGTSPSTAGKTRPSSRRRSWWTTGSTGGGTRRPPSRSNGW